MHCLALCLQYSSLFWLLLFLLQIWFCSNIVLQFLGKGEQSIGSLGMEFLSFLKRKKKVSPLIIVLLLHLDLWDRFRAVGVLHIKSYFYFSRLFCLLGAIHILFIVHHITLHLIAAFAQYKSYFCSIYYTRAVPESSFSLSNFLSPLG
jgi:hypothetical protein